MTLTIDRWTHATSIRRVSRTETLWAVKRRVGSPNVAVIVNDADWHTIQSRSRTTLPVRRPSAAVIRYAFNHNDCIAMRECLKGAENA